MRTLHAALFALFAVSGCGGDDSPNRADNLVIILKNRTGGHMNDFDLDTGSGHIQYQIFSKDYTFQKWIPITGKATLHLSYTADDGSTVDEDLEFEVEPSHNGSVLRITFGGEETTFDLE